MSRFYDKDSFKYPDIYALYKTYKKNNFIIYVYRKYKVLITKLCLKYVKKQIVTLLESQPYLSSSIIQLRAISEASLLKEIGNIYFKTVVDNFYSTADQQITHTYTQLYCLSRQSSTIDLFHWTLGSERMDD
jgi:predicted RND superfamily exporter protein